MNFNQSSWGKIGALAELVGVFFIGSLLASLLFQAAGIKGHPLMALTGENPDMFAISWQTAKVLLLQYIGWLALALVFTIAQRRHPLKNRGITRNGKHFIALSILGVGAWALGDLPNKLIWVLDAEFDLGTSVPWREALLNAEQTAGWWTLMAVGSFGLIPFLEEVFWRGYIQSRLQESFSPIAAIVITATMFTFSHSQYHMLDGYHVATILAVFIGSLVFGWLYYKTGSLIPAIVMHALLNFPTTGIWMYMVIALMTVIVALNWSRYKKSLSEIKYQLKPESWGLIEFSAIMFVLLAMLGLSQAPQWVSYLGYVGLPVALTTTLILRKKLKN